MQETAGSAPYRRAYIEISNICNLKCSFCPEVERDKQVMSPEAFATLAPQLQGLVDEVCLHLMGEPLNHPQLESILLICAQHALPVNLTTNGVLLNSSRRALLLSPIVRQINLSVHSFAANFGTADVKGYCERLFKFTRAATASRPDLYINLRLWDQTEHAVTTSANAALWQAIGTEFGVDFAARSLDLRRRKNLPLRGRIYLHCDSRFLWPSPSLPLRATSGFCHGLSHHFGVHADGTVVPCCLDKEAILSLGNTSETPLSAILQSGRAERMRAGFARGELVEDLCQRCPFISRFDRKARRLTAQAQVRSRSVTSRTGAAVNADVV